LSSEHPRLFPFVPFAECKICGVCGTTYKRRHWNIKSPSKKIVWQCINYIKEDADTGKRCEAKAVDDEVLKAAFVKVYNEAILSNFQNHLAFSSLGV